jgi:hypothetical protein
VGLDHTKKSDLKEFARKINADEVHIPEDWNYLVVSSNGKCEWFYVKGFINQQLHEISFERVSLLFGDNPPRGDEVVFSDVMGTGDGKEKSWGFDFRDRVVAKIGGDRFFVIRVDSKYVKSNRVHLISAFPVSKKVVEDAIHDHFIDSSISVFERIELGSLREALLKRRGGLV